MRVASMSAMPARPAAATLCAGCLLAAHAGLLARGAWVRDPTVDEPAHVAAGLHALKTGRLDLYPVNPPLIKVLAALPLERLGTNWDFSGVDTRPGVRREWTVGERWEDLNRRHPVPLLTQHRLARLTMIPWSVLGGWVCLRWARDLYGEAAGLLSCGLWCFSPLVLRNAAVVSMDVPGAATGLLAAWRLRHFLERPDARETLLAGLALGLALLCKHTWVVAFALWPAIALLWQASGGRQPPERTTVDAPPPPAPRRVVVWRTAAVLGVALFVLNLGYGFAGTFTPLGDYRFVSRALSGAERHRQFHQVGANRFAGTWLAGLPVPAPRDWLEGIDLQRVDFEDSHAAFVAGAWRKPPPWWGYFYALATGEPWGTWAAIAIAAVAGVRRRRAGRGGPVRDLWPLLLPPAVLLAIMSWQAWGLFYPRYALPAWAFVLVAAGGAGADARGRRAAIPALCVAAAAVAAVRSVG